MSDRFLKLSHWKPNQFGPVVHVPCSRITAVSETWDPHRNEMRSTVHLIGGELLTVTEGPDFIMNELALAPCIFRSPHG